MNFRWLNRPGSLRVCVEIMTLSASFRRYQWISANTKPSAAEAVVWVNIVFAGSIANIKFVKKIVNDLQHRFFKVSVQKQNLSFKRVIKKFRSRPMTSIWQKNSYIVGRDFLHQCLRTPVVDRFCKLSHRNRDASFYSSIESVGLCITK